MRVEDEEARHDDGSEADGNVDIENPAPAVTVGQPATEYRAEKWRDNDTESPEAHGFAAILRREGFEKDGLRNRLEAAAARALNHAADDQEWKCRSEST